VDEAPPLDDDATEVLYRWTVRALYVAAIALNVWYLAEQMRESPEWGVARRKLDLRLAAWKAKADPLLARLDFRRHAEAVIYEAETVVENAK
jgi:type IV secretory pathway TrbD component